MSGSVSVIQVMGYWFGTWLSCNRTTFPIWKFLDVPFYLVLYCSVTKIPFLHLDQNSFSTWHHLLLEYKSGLLKFPGGGISTFDLMVDVLLGEIGIWLSASIMASTVACLELTTASTSPISVLRGSSSNILPCVLMKAANTWLADLICSQMSPIWLLAGGFLSYTIQSETFFWRNCFYCGASLGKLSAVPFLFPQSSYHCQILSSEFCPFFWCIFSKLV